MDARWLDRCWPLTKYVQYWDINKCANAYSYIAHEPRSRRYRRVQTRQAQGDKSCSCSRCKQQLSPSRRVGREAYIGSYYRSRRSYYLSLSRVSTTGGSICAFRSKCTRRRSYISGCRCGNCTTCWTRSSCWIGGMFMTPMYIECPANYFSGTCCRYWRTTTRISWRLPWSSWLWERSTTPRIWWIPSWIPCWWPSSTRLQSSQKIEHS